MASEVTEEGDEKEAEKEKIRGIIGYQKSLYFSSSLSSSSCSSFSSAVASGSSVSSSRKRSITLLDLMRKGSTSLGRLFDMEHTSLGNYLKDYSVSPILKPLFLWGSDDDGRNRDDPWKEIGESYGLRLGGSGFVQEDCGMKKTRRQKLIRAKSYRRLPRMGGWACGGI